jgi:hypothetical protein
LIERIVSGGQTGCDRAAFDAALARSIPMSGWVPLGRIDEEGVIPARYPNLSEVGSADPAVRTEANVRDSDATLLISHGPLEGGSALTRVFCERQGRPWFHAALPAVGAREVCRWVERVRPAVLNVAGPRASEDPRVYEAARALLLEVLGGDARVSAKR